MSKKKNKQENQEHIFCAYEDGQGKFVEYLQQAKNKINQYTKNNYKLNLWKDINTNGKFIIEEIKKEIKNSNFFICELSKLNWNVFFELGYAIGCEKSVKLFLEDDSSQKEEFKKLKLLNGCGYTAYKSHETIQKSLEKGFNSQDDTSELKEFGKQCRSNTASDQLLIITNTKEEQAIIEIKQHLTEKNIPYKFNNTKEAVYRTKTWYKENISKSYGVIIHLSFDKEKKIKRENAENSFIAGICDAIEKPYMFIGHSSIDPPMDYKEHFVKYDKETEVVNDVNKFLEHRINYLAQKGAKEQELVEKQTCKINKIKPYFDFIAEEEDKILDYFFENQFYTNALNNQGIKIIVGRKGTGKTALFIKLKNKLVSSPYTITAILNPDKSDFRNTIEVLSDVDQSHKERILVTLWEIVILSTLCQEIKKNEKKQDDNTSCDDTFIKYLEQNKNIGFFKVLQEYQEKKENKHILEIHNEPFYHLIKNKFYNYIEDKKYLKLNIIADNLDCIWDEDIKRDVQANIIKSLFDYIIEFQKRLQDINNIKVNFCFFLREDIFINIKETIKFEIDKFEARTIKMNWENRKDDLKAIIDARFSNAFSITSKEDIEKAWLNHFKSFTSSKNAFDEIFKHVIIARPRDLIMYISNLFLSSNAEIISDDDFNEADKEYKSFVYDNMKLEINSIFNQSDIVFNKINKKFDNLYENMEGHEFMKAIQDELENEEESYKFLEHLIKLNYLTCKIDNTIYNDVEKIQNKFKEKKFLFFRKNKIYFRFNQ